MDQKTFNRELGDYLSKRKSNNFLSKIKKQIPSVKVVQDDKQLEDKVPIEEVNKVLNEDKTTNIVYDEFDEQIIESDNKVEIKGWRRVLRWIFPSNDDVDLEPNLEDDDISSIIEEPKRSVDEDVKRMLKIVVGWVNRLPPEDIKDIKRTPEYDEFKQLLDKYGLLKK